MSSRKVVLDTNCLISSLSRRGQYYPVWKGLQAGEYILCVSTDILNEYAELITQKMSVEVATNATFIVSDDKHYDVLKVITFPKILVLKLKEFLGLLQSEGKK